METLKTWCSNFLQWVNPEDEEEEESDDELAMKEEISFLSEILENILSRLPVKSILRFRSVNKPWLSLISDPSFATLQRTHANRAFFITAYDKSTYKSFFLSATHEGGSLTHLKTLDHLYPTVIQTEHLNGLVCTTSWSGFSNHEQPLVFNPSTHNIIDLPAYDPTTTTHNVGHYFGFNESQNEHKILRMVGVGGTCNISKISILSLTNLSWREIDATIEINGNDYPYFIKSSVCVNSVIYLFLQLQLEILSFDLRTETFSFVKIPMDEELLDPITRHSRNNGNKFTNYEHPYLIKINGCVGFVCYDCVVEASEIHIWILQYYENHIWVKETITFPEAWGASGYSFPLDSINMDEVIFSLRQLSRNVVYVPIYNMKTRCFKFVQFTLDHPFLRKPTVKFHQIKGYVESMVT